ncbi:uncharacterized protein BKA55DRAFT_685935 [Fusarium redolens]|uniref:Uncharacterized protein n=1 Tax=Fusarium redolens TaxID=48865 RepID=A0A9P9KKS7_FUSRE|nr:uncharacterized protein BKA55DRAFT_685935 [Fusarium redolens]KAH7265468.1 hypothetical protein BKA55DRAFT_685935 [Fusarium redolens]
MSEQRDTSEEARMIAKIYFNEFYRKVDSLERNPSGTVYDPRMGPPPPSPTLKEFRPAPPSPQAPRPDTPRPADHFGSGMRIPGKAIVNENWEENFLRVLGTTYAGYGWRNLGDMTTACWRWVRNKANRHKMDIRWSMEEIERYGRLSVWGVHEDVIEALIGWPANPRFTPQEEAHFEAAVHDELKYIPVTQQEAETNVEERQQEPQAGQ